MSWKTSGESEARLYNLGFTFPCALPVIWSIMATIPAKAGDATDVPPTMFKFWADDANPFTQELVVAGTPCVGSVSQTT